MSMRVGVSLAPNHLAPPKLWVKRSGESEQWSKNFTGLLTGAGGGIRTHNPMRGAVFETAAYSVPPRRRVRYPVYPFSIGAGAAERQPARMAEQPMCPPGCAPAASAKFYRQLRQEPPANYYACHPRLALALQARNLAYPSSRHPRSPLALDQMFRLRRPPPYKMTRAGLPDHPGAPPLICCRYL